MESTFTLENLKEKMKPDRFYRLDLVSGIYLDTKYEPDMIFKALSVSFSEYSDWYQQDVKRIKAISAKDRFKSKVQGNEHPLISTGQGNTFNIPVDVTNQIFLKPGSVWRNGQRVWVPGDSISISVDTSHQNLIPFRDLAKKITNLPFIKDSFYSNLIELQNCEVAFGNSIVTTTVYVPVMEVVRYYFSGSRCYTIMFYNGGLEDHRIKQEFIYRSNFDPETKHVYIWLRRKCKDSDAIQLCRAIADNQAMKAMKNVYSSTVNLLNWRKREKKPHVPICCPKTEFPFLAVSDIEVQGQWLPPDEDGDFSYLVRSIDKCHNPMPFESIEIESVDSTRSNAKKPKQSVKKASNEKRDDDKQNPNLTHDERPNDSFPENELEFYADRFPSLEGIEIKKVRKTLEDELEAYVKEEDERDKSYRGSTLPGNYAGDNEIESWDIAAKDNETIPVSERL